MGSKLMIYALYTEFFQHSSSAGEIGTFPDPPPLVPPPLVPPHHHHLTLGPSSPCRVANTIPNSYLNALAPFPSLWRSWPWPRLRSNVPTLPRLCLPSCRGPSPARGYGGYVPWCVPDCGGLGCQARWDI